MSVGGARAPRQRFELPFGCAQKSHGVSKVEMASPSIPSWNQIMVWLRDMAALRESGIVAA